MGELTIPDNPIEDLPALYQHTLVMDVALGVDEDTICEAYGLQYPKLQAIKNHPSFKARHQKLADELSKEGMSFRLKAQMQAEELLKTSFAMIHSEDVDPKTKQKLIADTVRWAGYDSAAAAGVGGGGTGISISINLGRADEATDGRVFENED